VTQIVADPVAGPSTAQGTPPRRQRWRPRVGDLWSDAVLAWVGPLLMTALGGGMRFWRLGVPDTLVFDEVYYVKEASSYLQYGYERLQTPVPSGSPDPFTTGHTGIFTTGGEFVVHPPVGKWMIGFGEWLLGAGDPAGWRFSAAVCGTLSILMLGRIAYRLLGSGLLATVAALLLAVDGLHFVMSRTGVLDIFVMFWALAAFGCLLIDRDRARARLGRWTASGPASRSASGSASGPAAGRPALGPWLGARPWRIAAVVCLVLCTGVKWSGIYVAAVLLALSVGWDVVARRAAGVRRWVLGGTVLDGAAAFVTSAVLLPAGYVATWAGWLAGTQGYDRQWAAGHAAAPGWGWVPTALRSLWHYHAEMWHFHLTLHTPHPYMANPWTWSVQGRPTAFFYEKHTDGHAGCHLPTCSEAVLALGNPVIWWAGTLALAVLLVRWLLARDHRAGAILGGVAGGWLPWFLYQERTIFQFYAVAFVPWIVLAVTYCLGLFLGPPGRPRRDRALLVGAYLLLAVVVFWFFSPILTARVIPHGDWLMRMWLPSWI